MRALPWFGTQPDLAAVLDRYPIDEAVKPLFILPILTHLAAGGDGHSAVPLGASYLAFILAAQTLDDWQDQDVDQPWVAWSTQRIMTSTLSWIFLVQAGLAHASTDPDTARAVGEAYSKTGVVALVGQNQSTERTPPNRKGYWTSTHARSSAIVALGAWSGVALTTKDSAIRKTALDFGWNLGAGLQVIDDCVDLSTSAANGLGPGWVWTYPVVLALEQLSHPGHSRLVDLSQQTTMTPDQSQEAVQLVTDMGGLALALGVASSYRAAALDELDRLAVHECPDLRRFAAGTVDTSEAAS